MDRHYQSYPVCGHKEKLPAGVNLELVNLRHGGDDLHTQLRDTHVWLVFSPASTEVCPSQISARSHQNFLNRNRKY